MAVPAPRRLCQVAASAPRIPPGYLNPAALSQLQTPACSALMSPSCCITASRFLPLEPPWAGEAAELGRMTAKLSHGRAERRAERSERAGVGGRRRVRSMPPGLGVLRGPAAPTQPEPRRERPQPARPEGSGWGFSWMPTACASEEDRSLCCSPLRWNKPSSGRSDKNLGVGGHFLFQKRNLL